MFEVPAVYPYDHEIHSSEAKLHAFYRALEQNDINNHLGKYVEPLGNGFVGLVTHGLYDANGNLKSDMFANFQEVDGPRTQARNLLRYDAQLHTFVREDKSSFEVPDPDVSDETLELRFADADIRPQSEANDSESSEVEPLLADADMYTSMLHQIPMSSRQFGSSAIALHNQSLPLPRSTTRPRIYIDSPTTQRIVQESLDSDQNLVNNDFPLSKAAQQVLMRSNYRVPYGISYDLRDDEWSKLHMRRRSLHVITTLLYLCMERRDYPRAWAALTCVLRGHWVDIRLVWMPAIELLAWRHSVFPTNTKSANSMLSWLVATNPKLPKSRHNVHRYIPKATDILPVAILLKLVNNEVSSALEHADQAVKSMQYATDPFCWALAGIARIIQQQLGSSENNEDLNYAEAHRIQQSFAKCLELNGVLPSRLRKLAANLGTGDSEIVDRLLDGAESDSEYEIESDVEVPGDQSGAGGNDDQSDDNKSQSNDNKDDSSDSDSSSSEAEPLDEPTPKRLKVEANSQAFFSQSAALGAELGSSDSDDF